MTTNNTQGSTSEGSEPAKRLLGDVGKSYTFSIEYRKHSMEIREAITNGFNRYLPPWAVWIGQINRYLLVAAQFALGAGIATLLRTMLGLHLSLSVPFGFVGGLLVWWLLSFRSRNFFRTYMQNILDSPYNEGETEWIVNRDGVEMRGQHSTFRLSWAAVDQVRSRPHAVELKVANMVFLLPRTVIGSATDQTALLADLTKWHAEAR